MHLASINNLWTLVSFISTAILSLGNAQALSLTNSSTNVTMGDLPAQGPLAASHNPVIVLVPGAWLTTIQYRELVLRFELSGYRTVIQQLPSVNSRNPDAHTVETDTTFVRNHLLLPEIRAGRDVVLLMHSYGGFPGPVAANGLSKKELSAQGKPGGIIGMIMLSAFVALEGQSLLDKLMGKTYSAWILQFNTTGQLGVADPPHRFYNDLPASEADALTKEVGLQSKTSFESPAGKPAWADNSLYDNRRVYLQTTLDNAIPLAGQRNFIANSGVVWDVQPFEAGHCSFISQPKAITQAVVQAVKTFQEL